MLIMNGCSNTYSDVLKEDTIEKLNTTTVLESSEDIIGYTIDEIKNSITEEAVNALLEISIDENDSNENNQALSEYEIAELVRVVDGDTIVVILEGKEEKVRFIGVNTPESVGKYEDNPQPFGKEASEFTKSLLKEGQPIFMMKDVGDRDKYQRLLRYIYLQEPNENEMEKSMINAILLKEGYASTMTIPPNVKYSDVFLKLEQTAKENSVGLWSIEN